MFGAAAIWVALNKNGSVTLSRNRVRAKRLKRTEWPAGDRPPTLDGSAALKRPHGCTASPRRVRRTRTPDVSISMFVCAVGYEAGYVVQPRFAPLVRLSGACLQ